MIRAAFLKRMMFAALASAFLEVRLPEIRWEDDPVMYDIVPDRMYFLSIGGPYVWEAGQSIPRPLG